MVVSIIWNGSAECHCLVEVSDAEMVFGPVDLYLTMETCMIN